MAGGFLQYVGDPSAFTSNFEVTLGTDGTATRFRITCPVLATLYELANYYNSFGAQVRFIGPDGGDIKELEIEVPGLTTATPWLNELFFDKWELLSNEGTDSIFANPILVGPDGYLNYNDKVVLSRLALDGGTVSQAVSNCNADLGQGTLGPAPYPGDGGTSTNQFQAPTSADAQQVAKMIMKGQTEYYVPNYVLRHTSYCSPGQTYNAATTGQGFIYTTSQMLSECESGWTYNLPGRLSSKIASAGMAYNPPPSDEAPYYTWGWLKKISRENTLANFMVEVNCEFCLALWSNIDYPLY